MSISKKFYSIVLAIIALFALVACGGTGNGGNDVEPVEGVTLSDAQALVNRAMGKVNWLDADRLAVTQDLTFATSNSFAPGVVISWESANTAVITNEGKVTRPVYGEGNATVSVTATFSTPYNLDDAGNTVDEVYSATKTFEFVVIEAGEVFNIARIKQQVVSGELVKGDNVTFTGVIVAKIAAAQGNQIIVHDGSEGLYVHAASELPVGTKVTVSGELDVYYDIYQIKSGASISLVEENATLPVITKSSLADHVALGKDNGIVGGRLVNVDAIVNIAVEGSYTNVYLIDPVAGAKFLVYYKTEYTYMPSYTEGMEDYIATLRAYDGKTVNITVAQYDLKDNDNRMCLTSYPITEVAAVELTDEEKAQFVLNGLSLEESYLVDFDLPVADGVVWSVKEGTGIEIVDGKAVVTRTAEEQTVVLTATVTVNQVVLTKDFTVVLPLVEATVDGVLTLNVNSMLIPANYASDTVVVSGVSVQYVELGNYGVGIQMRNKEASGGNRSQLWNTTALSGAITKIELVYNSTKSTFDNANCMIFSFGSDASALTAVNFSTVAGQTTYTVTPSVQGATYFKVELNPSYTYSMYWDSIVVYYGGEAGGETPDTPVVPEPTHTHTACPTCGLCTAEDCTGAATEKCAGHEVVVPGVVELTTATLGLTQNKYAAGTTTVAGVAYEYIELGYYENGIQMRNKEASGGNRAQLWNTTAFAGGITKIELVWNSGKQTYDNADVIIFSFGTSADALTYQLTLSTVAGQTEYTITLDSAEYTYFKLEQNVNYTYSMYWDSITIYHEEGTQTPDTPVVPEPSHEHVACETCGLCTAEDCTGAAEEKCAGHEVTPTEPEAIETTVAELAASKPSTEKTVVYVVEAIWTAKDGMAISANTYGNGFLSDMEGNKVTIYGLSGTSACLSYANNVYTYTNSKDFPTLNIAEYTIIKVGMVYTPTFDNYSAYLIEVVGPLADDDCVTLDKSALSMEEVVVANLMLPTVGAAGSTITWASNNEDVIAADGTVVRPAAGNEDAVVTLTATLTKGEVVETVEFVVTVTAAPSADAELVDKVYSYEFTSSQFTANGTKTLNGLSWTAAGDGGYWGYDSQYGKGQQFGSGNKPYKSLSLTSGSLKNVTKITINTAGASSINAPLVVTVGGVQIGDSIKLTSSATTYTLESATPLTGEIVLTYTQTSSKALYIKSIVVNYADVE